MEVAKRSRLGFAIPRTKAGYDFAETGEPALSAIVDAFIEDKLAPGEAAFAKANRDFAS